MNNEDKPISEFSLDEKEWKTLVCKEDGKFIENENGKVLLIDESGGFIMEVTLPEEYIGKPPYRIRVNGKVYTKR